MWTGFLPYSAILKKSSREHQNANGFNIIFPHRVMKEGMFILQKNTKNQRRCLKTWTIRNNDTVEGEKNGEHFAIKKGI